jgi:hypothetical protein
VSDVAARVALRYSGKLDALVARTKLLIAKQRELQVSRGSVSSELLCR